MTYSNAWASSKKQVQGKLAPYVPDFANNVYTGTPSASTAIPMSGGLIDLDKLMRQETRSPQGIMEDVRRQGFIQNPEAGYYGFLPQDLSPNLRDYWTFDRFYQEYLKNLGENNVPSTGNTNPDLGGLYSFLQDFDFAGNWAKYNNMKSGNFAPNVRWI